MARAGTPNAFWQCRFRRSNASSRPIVGVNSNRVASIRSCTDSAIGSAVIQARQTCATVYSSRPDAVSTERDASNSCDQPWKRSARLCRTPGHVAGTKDSTRNCSSISKTSRLAAPSGSSSICSSGSLCRSRSAIPSAAPRSVGGCRCGAGIGTRRPPRYSAAPRKCRPRCLLNARMDAARSSRTFCSRRISAESFMPRETAVSSSSRSKQRWKYSATIGFSSSSHLLTNDNWKARPTSPKITTFSAHVITVRGDIKVDRSPTRKPLRVRFATATIEAMSVTIDLGHPRRRRCRPPHAAEGGRAIRRCSTGRSARG